MGLRGAMGYRERADAGSGKKGVQKLTKTHRFLSVLVKNGTVFGKNDELFGGG
ncbi:MAG: hypothetical protein JW936_07370 [Sedimentisphaerales bacterium]|nr:hypothetical protein [Sedimentisphaerales bacterium]